MCSHFAHTIVSNVAKDVIIPQFAKGELAPVAMSQKILQRMQSTTQITVRLVHMLIVGAIGFSHLSDAL